MKALLALLRREPVMLGAAATATVAIAGPSELVTAAAVAWIGWLVRMLSTPTVTAEQEKAQAATAGYQQAVADVSTLQP